MLNSTYGMMVEDPIKDDIIYDGEWEVQNNHEQITLWDKLQEYNTSNNRFTFYLWGVFITAYARRNLYTGILEFGEDYIYADTDSIKAINYDEHYDYIQKYNSNITKKINICLKKLYFDF